MNEQVEISKSISKRKRVMKPEEIEEAKRKEQKIFDIITKYPGISAYEIHKKSSFPTGTVHAILERLKSTNQIFENQKSSKKLKNRKTKIYQTFPFPENPQETLSSEDLDSLELSERSDLDLLSKIEEYQKLIEGMPLEKDGITLLALEFEKQTAERLMRCVDENKESFQDFRDFVTKALIEYYKQLKLKVKQSGKK